jgi:hypothetical protein
MLNPRTITMIPAAMLMIPLIPPRNRAVAEKRTLKTIKTTLNPRTKAAVNPKSRSRLPPALPAVSGFSAVSRLVPPRKQSHEGISGSTQGEKKESNPAVKARKMDTLSFTRPPFVQKSPAQHLPETYPAADKTHSFYFPRREWAGHIRAAPVDIINNTTYSVFYKVYYSYIIYIL